MSVPDIAYISGHFIMFSVMDVIVLLDDFDVLYFMLASLMNHFTGAIRRDSESDRGVGRNKEGSRC